MTKTLHFHISPNLRSLPRTYGRWFMLAASLLFGCGSDPAASGDDGSTSGLGGALPAGGTNSNAYYCGLPFGSEPAKGHYRNGKATATSDDGTRELTEFTCQTLRDLDGNAVGYLAVFADRTASHPNEEKRYVRIESRDGTNVYKGDGTYELGTAGSKWHGLDSGALRLSNGGKHGELDDGSLIFDCDPADDTDPAKGPAFPVSVAPGTARVIDATGAVVTIPDVHCSGYNNELSVYTEPGVEAYYIKTDSGLRLDYPGMASDAWLSGLHAETTPSCETGHASLNFVVTGFDGNVSYSGEVSCQND